MPIFNKILKNFRRSNKPSDLLVNLDHKDMGPEDILSDAASPFFGDAKEKKLEIPVSSLSINLLFVFVIAGLIFLTGYSFYIGVLNLDKYKKISDQNAQQTYKIGTNRGDIYSADGYPVAVSVSAFNIEVNPSKLENSDMEKLAGIVSENFANQPYDYIYEKLVSAKSRNLGSLILLKNLKETDIAYFSEIIEANTAISLNEHALRFYPEGNIFSHIVGYTSYINPEELDEFPGYSLADTAGKKGVEYYFEKYLKGVQGLFAKFVTAKGEVIQERVLREAQKGSALELTVNYELQKAARGALAKAISENNLSAGAVVILDPNTGKVLSLISLPDYDPNAFVRGLTGKEADMYFNDPGNPLFNRTTLGEYATGSVIKPLIAAAALEEYIISPNRYIFTNGFIEVPSVYDSSVVYRFNDWKNHGAVDMREAIAVSSNVYFYTIGGGFEGFVGLGIEKITKWLNKFGWGEKLGIDFASESAGRVPDPEWKEKVKNEGWFIGDTYNTSIGQGDILATPLQVASAISVFANKSVLYRPYVVKRIYTQDGVAHELEGDIINRNFISSANINVVREGMREAVITGSSRFLSQLPVAVAGKTGTAQTSGQKDNAWFAGFAPYENPELAIVVVLEEGESSGRAVRVAYDILDWYFKNFTRKEQ
ncbi:MAG: penicillin-binding protein 2 [Candidatus Spechtbacterales bacterium]